MQFQRQSLAQEQRLKMNPQLLQSIKLMEMAIVDLRERIDQELERNPALELIEDHSIVRLNETETRQKEEYEYFETTSDPGMRGARTSEEHQRFIEGTLTRPQTLQGHLLLQLQLEPVDEELKAIAEVLIQNLNDDGFHIEKPETLFNGSAPARPPIRLQEAIDVVRSLNPAGTCTYNYRESLEVQIALLPDSPAGIEKVLDNLELLERGKFNILSKKIGINEDEIKYIYEFIKKLSPFPGRAFAPGNVRYVIPDIRVIRESAPDGDEFIIKLNDEAFPVLGINPFFEKLETSAADASAASAPSAMAARDFARQNIRDARLFINDLNQRNKTLLRVTHAIVQFQRSFFLKGPKHLTPLTLAEIAKELNVHETTVSRTANGKYMQTEWGIYEIRYFFTNSISGAGSGGSKFSKRSVKEIIREIIESENRLLSDQDISLLLSKKGIALARRTVAKYRMELDMGSSYTRKVSTCRVSPDRNRE